MSNLANVLIVGAHHEEIEAECPNIAAALAMAGCKVTILNPVGGWNWTFIRSLGADGRERTIANALAAAKELGCEKVIWDYPVAQVDRFRDEMIDRMAEFLLALSPDIVLMHWPQDTHADHRLVARATHHVLSTAPNLSSKTYPAYQEVKEVYAFQTGVSQAYHFVPDLFILTNEETMARADRAVECFRPTTPGGANRWKNNFHTKANYWGNSAGAPAEALKFLGPRLPLEGFLLKKILGTRVVPAALESFACVRELQL